MTRTGKIPWNKGKTGYTTAKRGKKLSPNQKKNLYKFPKGHVPWNAGKKTTPHSEEWKRQVSQKLRGENGPNWKGGVTPLHESIRKSVEYKLWRTAVFERDGYTCVWCFAKNGNGKTTVLHADHIKRFAEYPELRFAIDNGRTLCAPCHRTTDTYGRR